MTQLALGASGRVVRRLACGDAAVVARPATSKHLGVIHATNRRPARQAVAVLALRGGTYVIGWWCCGLYQAAGIVAPGTRPRRALENALDVTAFAIDISMGTIERPAGGEMIKVGPGCGLSVRLTKTQGENCQAG